MFFRVLCTRVRVNPVVVGLVILMLMAGLIGRSLAAAGDLDTSFSGSGVALAGFASGANDAARDLLVQPDGKILVAGTTVVSGYTQFAAARFTSSGNLDTGFDTDGLVTYQVGSLNDAAEAMAITADGEIILAGTTQTATSTDLAVMRLTNSGALDDTVTPFGTGGVATYQGAAPVSVWDAVVDSVNRVIVVGAEGDDLLIVRFTSAGVLDSTFGSSGARVIDFLNGGRVDVATGVMLAGSDLVISGYSNYTGASDDFILVRLDSSGNFVTSFGSGGQVAADYSSNSEDLAFAAHLDAANNEIYLAGYSDVGGLNRQFAVARFHANNGSLDNSSTPFGAAGWWASDLGSNGAEAYDIGLLPDGKVVVAGWSNLTATNEDYSLVRLTHDGALDAGFAGSGYRHVDLRDVVSTSSGSQDQAYALAIQADTRLLVAGESDPFTGNFDMAVLRVDSNNRPVLSALISSAFEDQPYTFSLAEFAAGFSDADLHPLASVTIKSLPGRGSLTLNGLDVSVDQVIPSADLGSLVYTPEGDFNGTDSFNWNASDGIDVALMDAVVNLNITAVNDAPAFTAGPNIGMLEDTGPVTVSAWATGINPGPADEAGQVLTFTLMADHPEYFSVQPALDEISGNLTLTPAPDANGVTTVTIVLQDDGGTADGGNDQVVGGLTITINPINDAPAFIPGPDISVPEDAGPQTVPGWATAIDPGALNEMDQQLAFHLAVDMPGLFAIFPGIDPVSGDLTFTPAPNAFGKATLLVYLMDSDGRNNGGENTSPIVTFTITMTAVNDLPLVSDLTVFGTQDVPLVFTMADFSNRFSDADGDLLAYVQIVSLPGAADGQLELDGIAVAAMQVIPVSELTNLSFVPAAGYYGQSEFTWSGSDGAAYAPAPAQVTIIIEPLGRLFLPMMRQN